MTRKQWLEIFIHLADTGAPALEYRKRLRLKTNALRQHINKLGKYRAELNDILQKEKDDERRRLREEARKREEAEKRRRAKFKLESDRRDDDNGEAMGTRENFSED